MLTRVLIADDHRLLRDGLRKTIIGHGMQVVGEATDGEEAVKMALALQPDVILMDVSMPYRDGIEATRIIKETHADMPIIILTMHIDEEVQRDASDVGADAYLFKDCSVKDIIDTIKELVGLSPSESVGTGETVSDTDDPETSNESRAQDQMARSQNVNIVSGAQESGLSGREIEILQLVADGLSVQQIADSLGIAERTVRNHLGGTYTKLGVSDKAQAIVRAIQLGLIYV